VTQRAMERSILDITRRDKISNKEVRSATRTTDIEYEIQKLKFSYAGHIERADSDRWVNALKERCLYDGRRSRGRPVTRLRD